MQLKEILDSYPDEELDSLAADKIDEVSSLRLPRQVIIQEIASALSSLSYVVGVSTRTQDDGRVRTIGDGFG